MEMLRVSELSKSFRSQRVLHNITFQVKKGESVALVGENGAGKTTLLSCLTGVSRPDKGAVSWSSEVRKVRGVLLQRYNFLYDDLSCRENLRFFAALYGIRDPHSEISTLLTNLALPADRPVRELSQGMTQRLAIARTLVQQPQVLLLDEPFANLDPSGQSVVCEMLENFRESGGTLIFSTHEEMIIRRLRPRVFSISHGQLTISSESLPSAASEGRV